jgi:hypothetical protein
MTWLFLGFLLQIAACALVGARLLALARRTRELPELAFGSGFLLLGVFGQPLAVLGRSPLAGSAELAGALLGVGLAAQSLGCLCLAAGTWRVFRPDSRWAGAAVAGSAAVFAVSLVGHGLTVGFAGGADRGAFYWAGLLARGGSFAWCAVEALLYHRRMRRRLRLGLGDPVVANRFLLWAIASSGLVVAFLAFLAAKLAGVNAATSPPFLATSFAVALVCSVAMSLAFFAPQAWTRRVAARAARVASRAGGGHLHPSRGSA